MRYSRAFEALANETGVELEEPTLTHLHEVLVEQGDFEGVERIMGEAVASGALNGFLNKQDYIPEWSPVPERSAENVAESVSEISAAVTDGQRPGMRGGHQMCLDPSSETIYLLGGWDGNQDLCDFWSYHIPSHQWTLISRNTESEVSASTAPLNNAGFQVTAAKPRKRPCVHKSVDRDESEMKYFLPSRSNRAYPNLPAFQDLREGL